LLATTVFVVNEVPRHIELGEIEGCVVNTGAAGGALGGVVEADAVANANAPDLKVYVAGEITQQLPKPDGAPTQVIFVGVVNTELFAKGVVYDHVERQLVEEKA
jgi:hypothetical protein